MPEQNAAIGERILIVKLTISEGLKMFGAKPKNVTVTCDLQKLAREARASYLDHLEV